MTTLRRALRSPAFVAGATLTALLLLVALAAPVIAPHSPTDQQLTAGLLPPSPEHWFGTDQLGRDVLSRMLFAARTDLGIAVLASIAPFVVGVTVGLVSGYFGGAVDWVASRITDTVIAFPFYVIVIALVFALGAGAGGIVVAFALVGWVGYARVLRAMTAALRDAGWVRSARGSGLSHARVLVRHVLPNVLPQAIVLLATEIALIMVAIVTLGYLGLGIRPPTPDWGTMIADAQQFITTHWWLAAFPGFAVVLTGIALSLLGDGLADARRVTGAPSDGRRSGLGVRRGRASAERRGITGRRGGRGTTGGVAEHTAPRKSPETQAPRGAVQVRDLRITQTSGRVLVDGVGFTVEPGGALGIVGESGSGKSLTLRAVLGLLPGGVVATSADSAVPSTASPVRVGGAIGMVFQDPLTALDPLTRVGGLLREAVAAAQPRLSRTAVHERVRALLADVHLHDASRIARSYPHELSGGQRQRVVIALALAGDPAVLLCDEPTTALDVTVQCDVLLLLRELRARRGMTLVFVSHDLAVVSQMCDEIIVMSQGTVVERGATRAVIRHPRAAETRALVDAVPHLPHLDASTSKASATPEGTAPPVLEVRDAVVRYGAFTAVHGASLALAAGDAIGIVGESGSGKTSLARAIVGQVLLASGDILLDGAVRVSARRSATGLRAVQLVPQDPGSSLTPRRPVGSVIAEVLRAVDRAQSAAPHSPEERRARVAELLRLVRLDPALASATPDQLSGGQRQRVAIARALAAEPRVLVADEPTSALDVSVQAGIVDLLQHLRRELGLALVFVSHDLAVVHALCDRVLVMRSGEVVERGGAEFFTAPRTAYGRELLSSVPRMPNQSDGN
ncbi:ABC transporter ATP-binding protein/permease [Leucobacter musarum]|uniref:ABC transporter ATP-binding protein/permease n=1 Tax=Leucobacter musarum TaxID=1930747 RepID=UPI0006A76F6F|nr:ATP-binding cassette domain-containing protein [Leucobacter musarum]